jgi:hypothetical protein
MATPVGQVTVACTGKRVSVERYDEAGRWSSRQDGRPNGQDAERTVEGIIRLPGWCRVRPGSAGVRQTVLADQAGRSLCDLFRTEEAGQ